MYLSDKRHHFFKTVVASMLLFLLFLLNATTANAEPVDVVTEVTSITEGRPFWIAVEIAPEKGRFISWIDHETGGSGLHFKLKDQKGFAKGRTILPPPGPSGVDGDYGYNGPVIVLQEIMVEDSLVFSKSYVFEGKVFWHECDVNRCTDNSLAYQFTLPYGSGAASDSVSPLFSDLRQNGLKIFPWPVEYRGDENIFSLKLYVEDESKVYKTVSVLPAWGLRGRFLNETLKLKSIEEGYFIEAVPPEGFTPRKKFEGILYVEDLEGDFKTYLIKAQNTFQKNESFSQSRADLAGLTLWLALAFAFLGGLLLNLMPCVFPILTLKIFSLVKSGGMTSHQMRLDGLAYTVGVLFSFLIVALLLLTFRSLGQQVGWGFQLQSPYFISAMAVILFLVALVFLGVINIRLPFSIEHKTDKDGALGSFYTGMMATLLATPCTAPFMAPALGFALTLEILSAIIIFLALGFGLAFPYLLVSIIPKAQSFFPKPGPWMETFKKALSIPVLLTVGWLGWVLYEQVTENGESESTDAVEWSPDAVWNARLQGRGVLVNYTAKWCLTCIVNERLVFKKEKFQEFLKEKNIIYMEADWTKPNPSISASLEVLGRSGLPVYAFYPPGGPTRDTVLLPEILTLEIALERIAAELE